MKTDRICRNCVHYPLCYHTFGVLGDEPCRLVSGSNYGFFTSKKEHIQKIAADKTGNALERLISVMENISSFKQGGKEEFYGAALLSYTREAREELIALRDRGSIKNEED